MKLEIEQIKEKENEYKEYIKNHVLNVQKAWDTMKSNQECLDIISNYIQKLNMGTYISMIDSEIKNHDKSKYSIEEFNAYRKEFYPISQEEKDKNKENFDKAWKHHYTNNLHHWNWWYETGNADRMPCAYVIEMICDWEAMGYQFGNTSKEWYEKNKDKIHLGERQRKLAESLMNAICK